MKKTDLNKKVALTTIIFITLFLVALAIFQFKEKSNENANEEKEISENNQTLKQSEQSDVNNNETTINNKEEEVDTTEKETQNIQDANNFPQKCTKEPYITDIGRPVYPIEKRYEDLIFLGQVFTAYDCGKERLQQIWGVAGDNYVLGSTIWLKDKPSEGLIETFNSLGYECEDEEEENCIRWKLDESVEIDDLMKIEPFHEEMKTDDCISCG